MNNCFDLVLSNQLSQLDIMVEELKQFCSDHAISASNSHKIELALHELVTNIINYAWNDSDIHEILLHGTLSDDKMVIEISDDGYPFNPLERDEPDINLPLEERSIGGLGVYFVKTIMDKVEYQRKAGVNRVILTKNVS